MNEQNIRAVLEHLDVYQPGRAWVQGNYLMHPCPFAEVTHKGGVDRHPSFGIFIDNFAFSYYNCFSCKQKGLLYILPDMVAKILHAIPSGDVAGMQFILQCEKEAFKDAEYKLPIKVDFSNKEKPEPLNQAAYENIYLNAWSFVPAIEYLENRDIGFDAIKKIGIQYDMDEKRLVFPIFGADQNLYGFTGRSIEDVEFTKEYPRIKDYFGFQKKYFMLGEHNLIPKRPTIVVEGLFGYASLIDRGVDKIANVVALLGSVMTVPKARTLLNSDTSIFLMLDNDEAGDVGTFGSETIKGAIELLKGATVYVPSYPEGITDIDDVLFSDIEYILSNTMPYLH